MGFDSSLGNICSQISHIAFPLCFRRPLNFVPLSYLLCINMIILPQICSSTEDVLKSQNPSPEKTLSCPHALKLDLYTISERNPLLHHCYKTQGSFRVLSPSNTFIKDGAELMLHLLLPCKVQFEHAIIRKHISRNSFYRCTCSTLSQMNQWKKRWVRWCIG